MATKSTLASLPPEVLDEVNQAIREDRLTIDDIRELLREHGTDRSRSAIGRYVKSAREQMEKYRQAQEVAKVWVAKLGDEPQGDVGRLLIEMLRTVSFQTLSQIGESADGAGPMDVMLLAKAIEHMSKAQKSDVEWRAKVDELLKARLQKAADEVAKDAKQSGAVSDDLIEQFRNKILGIQA